MNGRPDFEVMRLSASFDPMGGESEDSIEVKCKVYNVNYGRNAWLSESSIVIKGYSIFVNKVRNYHDEGVELKEAIDHAINECIEGNILREFFIERRDEVRRMTELDFTWKKREGLIREEEFADGKVQGKIEGKIEDILEILGEHGEVPRELKDEIGLEKDPEVLTKMLKMAAQAKSIEDFRAKLEEMKCCL